MLPTIHIGKPTDFTPASLQSNLLHGQGTTEAMSYSAIFSPLIRRSELYCSPVLLLGSIASGPRSVLHYALGLKPKHG